MDPRIASEAARQTVSPQGPTRSRGSDTVALIDDPESLLRRPASRERPGSRSSSIPDRSIPATGVPSGSREALATHQPLSRGAPGSSFETGKNRQHWVYTSVLHKLQEWLTLELPTRVPAIMDTYLAQTFERTLQEEVRSTVTEMLPAWMQPEGSPNLMKDLVRQTMENIMEEEVRSGEALSPQGQPTNPTLNRSSVLLEKPHVATATMEPRMMYLPAPTIRDEDMKYDDDDNYEPNMKPMKMKNEYEHDETDDSDDRRRKKKKSRRNRKSKRGRNGSKPSKRRNPKRWDVTAVIQKVVAREVYRGNHLPIRMLTRLPRVRRIVCAVHGGRLNRNRRDHMGNSR